jgi:hypothetical protein
VVFTALLGLCLWPVASFYGAARPVAIVLGLAAALLFGLLRHHRPGLFDGYIGERQRQVHADGHGRGGDHHSGGP